jgi:hypothetical protein
MGCGGDGLIMLIADLVGIVHPSYLVDQVE